jgi:hypothetical protein
LEAGIQEKDEKKPRQSSTNHLSLKNFGQQSQKSKVVEQLRADNDERENWPQEKLRTYLRRAVAEDFT